MWLLQDALVTKTIKIAKQNVICCRSQLPKRFAAIKEESEPGKEFECVVWISRDSFCHKTQLVHRFSAFWLRSKCSICSYQLNIWYEDHVSSSILNLFLPGDPQDHTCRSEASVLWIIDDRSLSNYEQWWMGNSLRGLFLFTFELKMLALHCSTAAIGSLPHF